MTKPRRFALSRFTIGRKWWDMVDFDYLSKLSESDLDFLEKFSQEIYRTSFKNDARDLYPEKTAPRRQVYADRNARERDVWNEFHRLPHDYTAVSDLDKGDDE